MYHVTIYTDGSCQDNANTPSPTGCGAVFVMGNHYKEMSFYGGKGTNNTAEVMAMAFALQHLKTPFSVTIYTDSQYCAKIAMGEWSASSNQQAWDTYFSAAQPHVVTVEWLRKDSHQHNKTAHQLANEGWRNRE